MLQKKIIAFSCFLLTFAFGLSQALAGDITVTDTTCNLIAPDKTIKPMKCSSKQITTNSTAGTMTLIIHATLLPGTKAPTKHLTWTNATTGFLCNAGWSGKKFGITKKWKETIGTKGKVLLHCHYKLPKKK